MSILSAETEALIKVHAIQSGRTPDEVVRDALLRRPHVIKLKGHVLKGPDLTPEERLQRVREISERVSKLPILDTRSNEDIIGFDENGLPSGHGDFAQTDLLPSQ
jgi:antitoxin VapB